MSDIAEHIDISALLARYPKELRQSALMPVLQDVQEQHGYLPVEALEKISSHLRIPIAHIFGVVSFYSQFSLTPRGKNIIKMCMGTACHIRGGHGVLDEIRSYLGIGDKQTTPDRAFTLEVVRCLGTCFLAPVIMVGSKYYGALTPAKARKIIDGYRDGNESAPAAQRNESAPAAQPKEAAE
jgi:NADH-quinone oxidoreductase subunit E